MIINENGQEVLEEKDVNTTGKEVETTALATQENNKIEGLEVLGNNRNSNTKINIITSIKDKKTLFNLENNVDFKLNDCVGEKIRVVDVMFKVIEKDLKEPIIDEETGEILKSKEYQMITILVDDNNKSYVTASKTFYFAMKKLCEMYQNEVKDGVEIEIIKTQVKDSSNKALNFKLL